ncbi:M23 family metallopeptidase [Streptomyces sp. NBC_00385]|uniref:M23 family metallopeptidase n=1 Tax=Streptomyces sp. NBC_00385 TaxID=2975733 RepID=UPI002DDA3AC4|nr:M23 family metallopeptidase [Streptomyces sp. NBC_00385]WRZ05121.1 M23 family metallopeptidase [Streptomyces sp. NBC_00385]
MSVRKAVMVLYRVCWIIFFAMVVLSLVTRPPFPYWLTWVPAAVAIALVLAAGRRARSAATNPRPAVEVDPPVSGRWVALNSPADKVPSHGIHGYGQTYAIDIVAEPEPEPESRSKPKVEARSGAEPDAEVDAGKSGGVQGGPSRPKFRYLWPVVRRNQHFPAFGAPLLAVADGTVVHASHSRRDHLSRNSGPALIYLMLIEASVRDVLGPGAIVGNHLVLDLGDGTYAMYAHLRSGSLRVRVGEEVRAGQMLAECGNSGNSTEPHVHFQLMDDPDLDIAMGVPFTWRGIGLPANGEAFTAGDAAGGRPVPGSGAIRAL